MHFFAYGTLMYNGVMKALAGRTFPTIPASIKGFRRVCLKDRVYPAMIPAENSTVHGILHREVDRDTCESLQRFEDDFYQHQWLEVLAADGHYYRALVFVIAQPTHPLILDLDWDPGAFMEKQMAGYIEECKALRAASHTH